MFGFLKKKLKDAVDKFTKKAEVVDEEVDEPIEEKPEKKEVEKGEIKEPKPIKKKKGKKKKEKKLEKKDVVEEEKVEVEKEDVKEEPEPPLPKTEEKEEEEKKGFFAKIFKKKEEPAKEEKVEPVEKEEPIEGEETQETQKVSGHQKSEGFLSEPKSIFEKITKSVTSVTLSENKFNELFWDLEVSLLENNVAVEVIEKIKQDLKQDLVNKKIPRNLIDKRVINSLRNSIEDLFNVEQINLIKESSKKKPYIIAMIGINGSGKTTTLAKIVHLFQQNKLEPVVAACDTFRAAAIQQLEEHTNKLGVKLIKHDYGSDPAAVAFDAVKHAESKNKDVVLIDTAGRLHSDKNLMRELEKIIRVAKPDLKIFVGESIAGNDVVEQVKYFNDKVGIDAIILAKADIDEKGGAAISVSYITGKPILYLGVGQKYDDLINFDKNKIIEQIGLAG